VTAGEKGSFENPPPPILAKDIKTVIETEVIIAAAGIAGLMAPASAAEAGAKTILLEKEESFHTRGLHDAVAE
jgi:heterodisulfide reductase subunit A-like polyferredoxin